MNTKIITIFISIILIFVIILAIKPFIYGIYLIHKQNGTVAIYDIGDGYRMHAWPGNIYYPIPINIDNNYTSSNIVLINHCISMCQDDDWFIGQAKTDGEIPCALFAVKKKSDLPTFDLAPDLLVIDKEQIASYYDKFKHEVYFPVSTLDELSSIVGFDVSKIELSQNIPGPLRPKGELEDYEINQK